MNKKTLTFGRCSRTWCARCLNRKTSDGRRLSQLWLCAFKSTVKSSFCDWNHQSKNCVESNVDSTQDAEKFGVKISSYEIDFGAIMERMRKLRSEISINDSAQRFADLGVDVFIGEAAFTSKDTVLVNGNSLKFAKAVICTGAAPAVPKIEGIQVVL